MGDPSHRRLRPRRLLALPAGVVAAGIIAACGSETPTVNTAGVERSIAATIQAQHGLHTIVSCPPHVARRAGTAFTCYARLDVGVYPVRVTVAGSNGRVVYTNPAPLVALDIAKVESAIRASIYAKTHVHAIVSCPHEVLQQDGLAFTCTTRGPGPARSFSVVERAGGRVRYSET
jgi:hypothetical protein